MKIIVASFLTFLYNDIITHIPVHWIRKFYLRILNRKISSSCVILMHTRILGIWNLEIGDRSVINQYCLLDCRRYPIAISHDVDVGPHTHIWTLGHDPNSESHDLYGEGVTIEDHVWIASRVTVLPGLRFGRGAVVGSSSVVTKSVKSKSIVAGNPAVIIGQRKNELNYKLKYNPIMD